MNSLLLWTVFTVGGVLASSKHTPIPVVTSVFVPTGTYTVSLLTPAPQPTIPFNGGNVMTGNSEGAITIYGIWYGNHSPSTRSLVKNFVNGLDASPWWKVVQTYTGDNGQIASNLVWGGDYLDTSMSLGGSLVEGDIDTIIDNAVAAAGWPQDTSSSIYSVFLSLDVVSQQSHAGGTWCTDLCGYHTTTQTSNLLYALIGDTLKCPGYLPPVGQTVGASGCLPKYFRNQTDTHYSTNKNQHADGMITLLAHEISETVSNFQNAWRDSAGNECADKCNLYFLDVKGLVDGGTHSPYNNAYNLDLGSNGKFLIQSMWSADKQGCVMDESETPHTIIIPGDGTSFALEEGNSKRLFKNSNKPY